MRRTLLLLCALATAASASCAGQGVAASPGPETSVAFVSSSVGTQWGVTGRLVGEKVLSGRQLNVVVDSGTISSFLPLGALKLSAVLAGTNRSGWRKVAQSQSVSLGSLNTDQVFTITQPLFFSLTVPSDFDPDSHWLIFEFSATAVLEKGSTPQSFTTYTCPDSTSRPGEHPPHVC